MGTTPRKKPHTVQEFWEATTPLPLTGCLLSLLGRSEYGNAWVDGCQERAAHRVAMELTRGPISKPMMVLHKCDVPGCINPDHLYLGTVADNARDKVVRRTGIRASQKAQRTLARQRASNA